jgi:raffinose/stachyose/melibiose transport system substrate-binding protein
MLNKAKEENFLKKHCLIWRYLLLTLPLLSVASFAVPKTVTISASTNMVGEQAKVLQAIANDFMRKNPDIKVDFTAPGSQYSNIMKIKAASDELPDVFSTHGWAKVRYGTYLADLRAEKWASRIDSSIRPLVTDEAGKVYVLPMDQDKSGMIYNIDILRKYQIEVPSTFQDFLIACEQIKMKSHGQIIPIHIGGSDNWPEGQFYDFFAIPAFISPKENYAKAFLDGSFDWRKFDVLPQNFLEMWQKGFINKDFITSKYMDSAKAFAEEKAAFGFYGPYFIEEVKKINPMIHAGMMPIPSMVSGERPTLMGGERTTWGVWKDSKNIASAKKFVAFYAKPENIKRVAESNQLPAGLKGVNVNCGEMTFYYQKYANLRIFPYWDRAFLPSGMWEYICRNAQDLVAGAITPHQFSENMEREYKRLKSGTKSNSGV